LNFELEEKEPYLVDSRPRKTLEKTVYTVDRGQEVFGLELKGKGGERILRVEE